MPEQHLGSMSAYLKEYRSENQLTQSDLAESIGCSTSYVYTLEPGEANPNWDMLAKLSTALHLTGDEVRQMLDVDKALRNPQPRKTPVATDPGEKGRTNGDAWVTPEHLQKLIQVIEISGGRMRLDLAWKMVVHIIRNNES